MASSNSSLFNLQAIYEVLSYGNPLTLSGDAFLNHRIISSYKQNISTTTLDDLSEISTTTVIPYPNGIQLAVSSSSTSDALSGSGARKVHLLYLDSNFDEVEEEIILNGTTKVNTVATDIRRIQSFYVSNLGTVNGTALGTISVTNTAGTLTYDVIAAGGNQSLTSHFTIPNGYTGFITNWKASSTKQAISLRLRATVEKHSKILLPGIFLFQDALALNNSAQSSVFKVPLLCPERTDIKISAISSAGSADASASYEILLIKNNGIVP